MSLLSSNRVKNILRILVVVLRSLMGFILIVDGLAKVFSSQGMVDYMVNALHHDKIVEHTFAFYSVFIENVVIPNKFIFAVFTSWGQAAIGLSLISGLLTRVSIPFGMFTLINYGLMKGSFLIGGDWIFAWMLLLIYFVAPGSFFGIDRLLKKKWPESRLW